MNFLVAIIDALVGFVRRNPLLVLIILILAIGAPAVLKGLATFILYFILGIIVLVVIAVLAFRWRIYKLRQQMEQQYGKGFEQQQGFGQSGSGFPFGSAPREEKEGEVKVFKTQDTPEKRVSKNVGDYVEFEETKDKE